MGRRLFVAWLGVWLGWGSAAWAVSPPSESDIDPNVFRINQQKVMGVRFGRNLPLLDEEGQPFTFDQRPNLPTVLVPGYYTCDGNCSVVAMTVKELLKEVKAVAPGRDFTVLSLSFDKNDTRETQNAFRKLVDPPGEWASAWRVARIADPERIKPEMDKLEYRFFWSPRDKTFFHPTVFLILTPEGRVARVLDVATVGSKDVELALLEAKSNQFKPSETVEYLVSLCYSYNYKEGRYTVNIPIFVGAGAFLLGVGLLVGSTLFYRFFRYNRRKNA